MSPARSRSDLHYSDHGYQCEIVILHSVGVWKKKAPKVKRGRWTGTTEISRGLWLVPQI